jgi:hypothetical protein
LLPVTATTGAFAASLGDERDVDGQAWREQHAAHAVEPALVEGREPDLSSGARAFERGEPGRRRATVDRPHALAERGEVARDRHPGRSEPHDQARRA